MQVFAMPDVGEGLTEAEILAWHVAVGDTVTVNQVIVEIETAKAAVELPCPYAGTVAELLAAPGTTVTVGAPIIAIEAGAGVGADGGNGGAKIGEVGADGRIATLVGYVPTPGAVTRRPRRATAPLDPAGGDRRLGTDSSAGRGSSATDGDHHPDAPAPLPPPTTVPLAKPPVRRLARELGVDLRTLAGSGSGGVVTREDVRAVGASAPATPASAGAGERREPVRGVRRATAAAMVASAFTAPHVTEFLTVDVTPMIDLRNRLRASVEFADVKLSPLTFAAKAVCLAARRTPEVNASWADGGDTAEIVYFDHLHLGIAAATPRGLIVPKIRDADRLTLRELAEALAALTVTARDGATPPADLRGGTFTITNVGVFGVDTGTPILNPGESAILALGAVKQAPWVVDGALAVRTVCQLALSFDHRVVDGAQGSRFLADVGALLADPALALTY